MPFGDNGFRALPPSLDPRLRHSDASETPPPRGGSGRPPTAPPSPPGSGASPPAVSSAKVRQTLESLRSSLLTRPKSPLSSRGATQSGSARRTAGPSQQSAKEASVTPSYDTGFSSTGSGHGGYQSAVSSESIPTVVAMYQKKLDDMAVSHNALLAKLEESDAEKRDLVEKIEHLTDVTCQVRDDALQVEQANSQLAEVNRLLENETRALGEQIRAMLAKHESDIMQMDSAMRELQASKQSELTLLQDELERVTVTQHHVAADLQASEQRAALTQSKTQAVASRLCRSELAEVEGAEALLRSAARSSEQRCHTQLQGLRQLASRAHHACLRGAWGALLSHAVRSAAQRQVGRDAEAERQLHAICDNLRAAEHHLGEKQQELQQAEEGVVEARSLLLAAGSTAPLQAPLEAHVESLAAAHAALQEELRAATAHRTSAEEEALLLRRTATALDARLAPPGDAAAAAAATPQSAARLAASLEARVAQTLDALQASEAQAQHLQGCDEALRAADARLAAIAATLGGGSAPEEAAVAAAGALRERQAELCAAQQRLDAADAELRSMHAAAQRAAERGVVDPAGLSPCEVLDQAVTSAAESAGKLLLYEQQLLSLGRLFAEGGAAAADQDPDAATTTTPSFALLTQQASCALAELSSTKGRLASATQEGVSLAAALRASEARVAEAVRSLDDVGSLLDAEVQPGGGGGTPPPLAERVAAALQEGREAIRAAAGFDKLKETLVERVAKAEERAEGAEQGESEARVELERLRAELSEEQSSCKSLRVRAESVGRDTDTLRRENDVLRRQAAESSHKAQRLEEDHLVASRDLSAAQRRLGELEDETSVMKRLHDESSRKAARAEHAHGELEKDVASMREKLSASETAATSLRRQLIAVPTAEQLQAMEEDATGTAKRLREAEDGCRALRRERDELADAAQRVETERDALETRLLTERQRQRAHHERVGEELKQTISELSGELSSQRSLLAGCEAEKRDAKKQQTEGASALDALQEKHTALALSESSLRAELTAMRRETTAVLQPKVQLLQSDLRALEHQVAEKDRTADNLKEQLAAAVVSEAALQAELASARSDISTSLQPKVHQLQADLRAAEQQLAAKEQAMGRQKEQHALSASSESALHTELAAARSEIATTYQPKVLQLQADLRTAERKAETLQEELEAERQDRAAHSSIKTEYAAARREMAGVLQPKIDQLEADLRHAEQQADLREQLLDRQREQQATAAATEDRLRADLRTARHEAQEVLRPKILRLEEGLQAAQQEVLAKEQALVEQQAFAASTEAEADMALAESRREIETHLRPKLKQLEQELQAQRGSAPPAAVPQELGAAHAAIRELQAGAESHEAEVAELRRQLDSKASIVDTLKSRQAASAVTADSLAADLEAARSEVQDELQPKVQQLQADLRETRRRQKESQATADALQEEVLAARAENDVLHPRVQQLQAELRGAQRELKQSASAKEDALSEAAAASRDRDDAQSDAQRQRESLGRRLQDSEERRRVLDAERGDLLDRAAALEEQALSLQAANTRLETALSKEEMKAEVLAEELHEAQEFKPLCDRAAAELAAQTGGAPHASLDAALSGAAEQLAASKGDAVASAERLLGEGAASSLRAVPAAAVPGVLAGLVSSQHDEWAALLNEGMEAGGSALRVLRPDAAGVPQAGGGVGQAVCGAAGMLHELAGAVQEEVAVLRREGAGAAGEAADGAVRLAELEEEAAGLRGQVEAQGCEAGQVAQALHAAAQGSGCSVGRDASPEEVLAALSGKAADLACERDELLAERDAVGQALREELARHGCDPVDNTPQSLSEAISQQLATQAATAKRLNGEMDELRASVQQACARYAGVEPDTPHEDALTVLCEQAEQLALDRDTLLAEREAAAQTLNDELARHGCSPVDTNKPGALSEAITQQLKAQAVTSKRLNGEMDELRDAVQEACVQHADDIDPGANPEEVLAALSGKAADLARERDDLLAERDAVGQALREELARHGCDPVDNTPQSLSEAISQQLATQAATAKRLNGEMDELRASVQQACARYAGVEPDTPHEDALTVLCEQAEQLALDRDTLLAEREAAAQTLNDELARHRCSPVDTNKPGALSEAIAQQLKAQAVVSKRLNGEMDELRASVQEACARYAGVDPDTPHEKAVADLNAAASALSRERDALVAEQDALTEVLNAELASHGASPVDPSDPQPLREAVARLAAQAGAAGDAGAEMQHLQAAVLQACAYAGGGADPDVSPAEAVAVLGEQAVDLARERDELLAERDAVGQALREELARHGCDPVDNTPQSLSEAISQQLATQAATAKCLNGEMDELRASVQQACARYAGVEPDTPHEDALTVLCEQAEQLALDRDTLLAELEAAAQTLNDELARHGCSPVDTNKPGALSEAIAQQLKAQAVVSKRLNGEMDELRDAVQEACARYAQDGAALTETELLTCMAGAAHDAEAEKVQHMRHRDAVLQCLRDTLDIIQANAGTTPSQAPSSPAAAAQMIRTAAAQLETRWEGRVRALEADLRRVADDSTDSILVESEETQRLKERIEHLEQQAEADAATIAALRKKLTDDTQPHPHTQPGVAAPELAALRAEVEELTESRNLLAAHGANMLSISRGGPQGTPLSVVVLRSPEPPAPLSTKVSLDGSAFGAVHRANDAARHPSQSGGSASSSASSLMSHLELPELRRKLQQAEEQALVSVDELRSRLEGAEGELECRAAQLREASARVADLEDYAAHLQENRNDGEDRHAQQQLRHATERLATMEVELDEARQQLDVAESDKAEAAAQLGAEQASKETADAQLRQLRAEKLRAEAALTAVTQECDRLRQAGGTGTPLGVVVQLLQDEAQRLEGSLNEVHQAFPQALPEETEKTFHRRLASVEEAAEAVATEEDMARLDVILDALCTSCTRLGAAAGWGCAVDSGAPAEAAPSDQQVVNGLQPIYTHAGDGEGDLSTAMSVTAAAIQTGSTAGCPRAVAQVVQLPNGWWVADTCAHTGALLPEQIAEVRRLATSPPPRGAALYLPVIGEGSCPDGVTGDTVEPAMNAACQHLFSLTQPEGGGTDTPVHNLVANLTHPTLPQGSLPPRILPSLLAACDALSPPPGSPGVGSVSGLPSALALLLTAPRSDLQELLGGAGVAEETHAALAGVEGEAESVVPPLLAVCSQLMRCVLVSCNGGGLEDATAGWAPFGSLVAAALSQPLPGGPHTALRCVRATRDVWNDHRDLTPGTGYAWPAPTLASTTPEADHFARVSEALRSDPRSPGDVIAFRITELTQGVAVPRPSSSSSSSPEGEEDAGELIAIPPFCSFVVESVVESSFPGVPAGPAPRLCVVTVRQVAAGAASLLGGLPGIADYVDFCREDVTRACAAVSSSSLSSPLALPLCEGLARCVSKALASEDPLSREEKRIYEAELDRMEGCLGQEKARAARLRAALDEANVARAGEAELQALLSAARGRARELDAANLGLRAELDAMQQQDISGEQEKELRAPLVEALGSILHRVDTAKRASREIRAIARANPDKTRELSLLVAAIDETHAAARTLCASRLSPEERAGLGLGGGGGAPSVSPRKSEKGVSAASPGVPAAPAAPKAAKVVRREPPQGSAPAAAQPRREKGSAARQKAGHPQVAPHSPEEKKGRWK